MNIKRGDIVLVNLEPTIGSEQGKTRPVLVIQNDIGNEYSPLTIIASITSRVFEKQFPTNVFLSSKNSNLEKDSTVLLNQIRTIDKKRIVKKISSLDFQIMQSVDRGLVKSLDISVSNLV